jgi:hypothetical protein
VHLCTRHASGRRGALAVHKHLSEMENLCGSASARSCGGVRAADAGHRADSWRRAHLRALSLRCRLQGRARDAHSSGSHTKEESMANRRLPDGPSAEVPPVLRPPRARHSPTDAPLRASVTPEARRALIAQGAYLRAERRGFEPGHETDDWLAAELEVDALLTAEGARSAQ